MLSIIIERDGDPLAGDIVGGDLDGSRQEGAIVHRLPRFILSVTDSCQDECYSQKGDETQFNYLHEIASLLR